MNFNEYYNTTMGSSLNEDAMLEKRFEMIFENVEMLDEGLDIGTFDDFIVAM